MAKDGRGGRRQTLFDDGGGHKGTMNVDYPGRINKAKSMDGMLNDFNTKYGDDKIEHLIAYDDNGGVTALIHGDKNSVGFMPQAVEGKNVMHNHPKYSDGSYGTYSQQDLLNLSTTGAKSMGVRFGNDTWTVTKTKNFNAEGWTKALKNAKTYTQIKTMADYNKAVKNFLMNNASKYGLEFRENGKVKTVRRTK